MERVRCTIWISASLPTHLTRVPGIDKTFTSEEASTVLRLSFEITGIPRLEVRGEAISEDELLLIGMFAHTLFERTQFSDVCSQGIMHSWNKLVRCFKGCGNLPDIMKAISALQLSVRLTPAGHGTKPALLNDLGICFRCRF